MVHRNLAQKTNNFEDADKEMAFGVWYIEKEFNVGPITDEFPLMKFLNLLDEENIKKYNEMQKSSTPEKSSSKTFR